MTENTVRQGSVRQAPRDRGGISVGSLVGACKTTACQATGSLRHEAIVSQKLFFDPVTVFAGFQGLQSWLLTVREPPPSP